MKYLTFLIIGFLLFSSTIFAQVAVSTDGSAPDNSAMLDVKSTSKGILPPRMTTGEINAIANPAEGLSVYNSSVHCPVYFNGTGWKRTDGQFYIGASYGGGIIFYIDGTGQHGLISATSNQGFAPWGCNGTSIPGTSTALGTGQANTTTIINTCSEAGIAARICDDLVLNGYSDWFLPSEDELVQMYLQNSVIGGFTESNYWSSSENSLYLAWIKNFYSGAQYTASRSNYYYVRAIRTF
ncbi:MAG: DUF1566 domain-containing protein [Bacteroidales bacterium]